MRNRQYHPAEAATMTDYHGDEHVCESIASF